MDGAAQKFFSVAKNPGVFKTPRRQSKWRRGLDPEGTDNTDGEKIRSIELGSLVSKGGRKGRINDAHSNNWSFFPKSSDQNTNILNFLPDSNVQEAS